MFAGSRTFAFARVIAVGIFSALALFAGVTAKAQQSSSWTRCNAADVPADFQIGDCTAVLAETFYNRGTAYYDKGDYERAIADYDKAISFQSDKANALNNRGLAYQKKGNHGRAIADFNAALRADPNNSIAFNNRGSAYYHLGDYAGANADFNEAIRLEPRYADALNNRCWMRAVWGQLQEALVDCNESLRLNPKSAEALDSRGFTYLKMGQIDYAIRDYDAALAQTPTNAQSLYGRGWAKLRRNDRTGGNADIAAAKTVTPDIAERFARLGVPATENVANPSASPADPPTPRYRQPPLTNRSATVKELFEKYDLIGTFAADCSRPVTEQNEYIVHRLNSDFVQRDRMTDATRTDASLINSVTETDSNELRLGRTSQRGRMNEVVRVETGRWRLLESASESGEKLISGGWTTQGTRKQSPWLRKCS
jgi:tetratricopeptide (TPR) repeat protein